MEVYFSFIAIIRNVVKYHRILRGSSPNRYSVMHIYYDYESDSVIDHTFQGNTCVQIHNISGPL